MNLTTIHGTKANPPARVLRALPLLALALLFAVTACAGGLPSGEKVMEDYIKAMGGRKAIEKHENSLTRGTMMTSGIEMAVTIYAAEPNLSYFTMESAMTGKIESGCNGEVAWELSVMQGGSVKEGEDLEVSLREAVYNGTLHYKEHYTKIENMGIEEIDGVRCYKVVLTPKVGNPVTQYFDVETHLVAKSEATMSSPMGEIPIVSNIGDYREVDGEMVAFRTRTVFMGTQEMVMTTESVEFNVDIPEGTFDLPADIKALLAD